MAQEFDAINTMGTGGMEYNRDPAPKDVPSALLMEFIHTLKPFKKKQVKNARTGQVDDVIVSGDVDEVALKEFWGFTNHINGLSYCRREDLPKKELDRQIAMVAYRWTKPRREYTADTNAKMEQLSHLIESIGEMSVDGFGHVMGVTQRLEQSQKNEFKQISESKPTMIQRANNVMRGGQ
jgi:hypothetical protein